MVKEKYIPQKGDIVWLSFDPTVGHEQKGFRPAYIASSRDFNKSSGMAYVCPVSSKEKNYVTHIAFSGKKISGYICTEHLRAVDWRARKVRFEEDLGAEVVENVSNCISAILD